MICIITFEYIKILHGKLVGFGPSDSQAFLLLIEILFLHFRSIQQIKNLFIINLQKRTRNGNVFGLLSFLSLPECISNSSNRNTIIKMINISIDLYFTGSLIRITFLSHLLIFITFHCICLSRTCLSICKYGSMEPINNFSNEPRYLKWFKHILLRMLVCYDFIKCIIFLSVIVRLINWNVVFICFYFHHCIFVALLFFMAK